MNKICLATDDLARQSLTLQLLQACRHYWRMFYHPKAILTCIISIFIFHNSGAQSLNESFLHAKASMLQNKYEDAASHILSIPEIERTSAMYLLLGESYYAAARYEEAVSAFEASEKKKSSTEVQLSIARSYAQLTQAGKACEWLEKYLSQRNKLSESELTLEPAFAKIEHSKEWKILWNKEWYNSSEQKAAEATVLIKRKKYTDALRVLDTEIAQRASSARLYALRGKTYAAMGQDGPALTNYNQALQLISNDSKLFAEAAEIAGRLKKDEEAIEDMNRAIRIDPYQLELYLQRAGALRLAKRYEEARADLNFYFNYFPADTKALYQMGMSEVESGNTLSGIEYLSMALEKDQTSIEYFMARANACIQVKNYGIADDDLAQALDLNPQLPEAWFKKGVVLYELNDTEEACYYWQKALQLGSKEASEYINKYCIPSNSR